MASLLPTTLFHLALRLQKKNYQDALTEFESQDKEARGGYKDEKDGGSTSDNFKTWVTQNVSPC